MNFGLVVDIIDPEKLGRCKVNVYGVHDNIDTKDLPWSQVIMPGNTPALTGQGHSVNLAVGTLVCGIFKDSEQQEFMVQGTLPTKTDGVEDNNIRVRAGPDPHAGEPIGEYQPVSTYAPEYPYNNVMETESGHLKEYDDTKGHERITERHMSGTQYEVCADGTKNERIVRDNYRLVVGQDTLEVFGNVRIIVSGQADIAVAKDVNIAVGGNLTADVTGNMTANITGTTSLIGVDNIKIDVTGSGKKITLDGDVDVTGNLRLTTEGITLNTHTHGSNNVNQANTAGPNTN